MLMPSCETDSPQSTKRKHIALWAAACLVLVADASAATTEAVTAQPWQEVVVSVSDLDRTARFFTEIGQYQAKWRGALHESEIEAWELPQGASGEALLIGPQDYETGLIRLVRFDNAGERVPMRPGSKVLGHRLLLQHDGANEEHAGNLPSRHRPGLVDGNTGHAVKFPRVGIAHSNLPGAGRRAGTGLRAAYAAPARLHTGV